MLIENKSLIYDWNQHAEDNIPVKKKESRKIYIHDETLRDGAQAAGIIHSSLEKQLSILRLMNTIGIQRANIGFPISSRIQLEDIREVAHIKKQEKWQMELMCAARTNPSDVQGIIDISQQTGVKIWAGIFLAGSEIRAKIMGWDLQEMAKKIPGPITLAKKHNLPVMFVTEDTTRSHPKTISLYNQIAIDCGANQLCICDTVGHADEDGIVALVHYFKNEIIKNQKVDDKSVDLEYHGHNHRGLAVVTTRAAIKAGVNNVESTLLGIGEMMGNCPTEVLLLNADLEDMGNRKLKLVNSLLQEYSQAIQYPIPKHWIIAGDYAYSTGSGVHGDAIMAGYDMGDPELAELVYSSYRPSLVGRDVDAFIGQMSGKGSVRLALLKKGIPNPSLETVERILEVSKRRRVALSEQELLKLAKQSESKLW